MTWLRRARHGGQLEEEFLDDWMLEKLPLADDALASLSGEAVGAGVARVPLSDAGWAGDLCSELAGGVPIADVLQVRYQPIVDLGGAGIVGAEALIRGRGRFEGLEAERILECCDVSGRRRELAAFLCEQTCRDLANHHLQTGALWFAINLDEDELLDPELCGLLCRKLVQHGIAARDFVIEVSERTDPSRRVQAALGGLIGCGIRIGLDDVGSSRNSIRQLLHLEYDYVKFDKSVLAELDAMGATRMLHLIRLLETWSVETVAEGIETSEDHLLASVAGAHLGQGFRWSEAIEAAELQVLCRDGAFR